MATELCRYHSTNPAVWQCDECCKDFCDNCIVVIRQPGRAKEPRCPLCENRLTFLGTGHQAKPFWTVAPMLFTYPFNGAGISVLVVATVLGFLIGSGFFQLTVDPHSRCNSRQLRHCSDQSCRSGQLRYAATAGSAGKGRKQSLLQVHRTSACSWPTTGHRPADAESSCGNRRVDPDDGDVTRDDYSSCRGRHSVGRVPADASDLAH